MSNAHDEDDIELEERCDEPAFSEEAELVEDIEDEEDLWLSETLATSHGSSVHSFLKHLYSRLKQWAISSTRKQWVFRVLCLLTAVLLFWYFIDLVTPYQPSLTGDIWESKTATEKMDQLWGRLLYPNRGSSYGWYSLISMIELFTENLQLSFTSVSDQMPTRSVLGTQHHRKKLIHSVGAVAPAKFVKMPGSNNYTGLFEGADNLIIRMSHAVKPDFSIPKVVPGMAIKFLIDGQPSANIFAMFSLLGQTSYNFFAHDFSNHAPYFDVSLADSGSQSLFNAFLTVSKYPTLVGASGLAEYSQQGQPVTVPTFPFRLQFHPVKARHDRGQPDLDDDSDTYVVPELAGLPAGPLYEVYAQDTPLFETLVHIGTIITTAETISADYSDRNLFFQHRKFEQDLSYRREWEAPI